MDFYLQGATVTGAPVTIGSGSSGTVTVVGVGSLAAGDSVRIGLNGVILSVTSVPSSTQLTLSNSSGVTAILESGARLVNLSRRPTIYQDELGTTALTPPILTDSGGRVSVYLPGNFYDYVVSGDVIAADATSNTSIAAATSTMTWSHTASGDDRMVVVAIAWQESMGLESLDLVTYDGAAMVLLSANSLVQVYALVDPPTGAKNIVATWSGSGTKAAIGGAASFNHVDLTSPYALAPRQASGSNASPTLTFTRTQPNTLFQDCLAVNTVPAAATATVGTGQTSLWNGSAGTVPATTRTTGASSSIKKSTDSVTMGWSLSNADPWYLSIVELLPAGIRLYTDEQGEVCGCAPFALNAADYPGLQEAIDALPDSGGILLIPAGTYALDTTLRISRGSVTVIGAGPSTRIVPADPEHNPIDLINVSAGLLRMSNLLLDAQAVSQDLETGTSCLVFDGLGVSGRLVLHCFLENVVVQGASKAGIWLRDTIIFTAINCESIFNPGDGLRIQGTDTLVGSSTTINFTNCSLSQNGGIGAHVGDEDTGTVGINFVGCVFEDNQGDGYTLAEIGTGVYALQCAKLSLYSCYFEEAPAGCEQYVYLETSQNCVVDNCWFQGGGVATRAALFATSFYSRFTSNSAEGFTENIVLFDEVCTGCVEFANRDLDSGGVPRIVIDGDAGVIGMSRNAIGLPRVLVDANRPTGTEVKKGSLLWINSPGSGNSNLQIWDGTAWKNITLT